MLLNGHNLYGVVSVGGYARQHIVGEFCVSAHPFFFRGHANVTFVYEQRVAFGLEVADAEAIRACGILHLSGEDMRFGVLHHTRGISRDSLSLTTGPGHEHLVEIAVMDSAFGYDEFPNTVADV